MTIFDRLFLLLRVAAVITLLCAAVAAQRGRGRPALAIGAIAYLAIVAVVGRE